MPLTIKSATTSAGIVHTSVMNGADMFLHPATPVDNGGLYLGL